MRDWRQVPLAVVTLRPGSASTVADMIAFCTRRLACDKLPARVCFADELPRSAAGKRQRRRLRAAFVDESET